MKIGQFPFMAKKVPTIENRITGIVKMPEKATIIHIGAVPPQGELFIWAEVPEISTPSIDREFAILQANDSVPPGYTFMSIIIAVPILFVYERKSEFLLQP